MSYDVLVEEFGGDAQCVLVSATKGTGLVQVCKDYTELLIMTFNTELDYLFSQPFLNKNSRRR